MAKTSASKNTKTTAKPAASKPVKAKPAPKAKSNSTPASVAAPAAVSNTALKASSAGSSKTISAQDRYHMIDEAAYYRAEKNGFQVDPHANWIAAEKEIDELLAKQNIKVA